MKIEQLIPPLELCKLIPKGEFEDSALLWFSNYHFGGWHIEKRELAVAFTDNGELYPAPTLQEILADLKGFEMFGNTRFSVGKGDLMVIENNMIESAMLAWLNLKGIKTK